MGSSLTAETLEYTGARSVSLAGEWSCRIDPHHRGMAEG